MLGDSHSPVGTAMRFRIAAIASALMAMTAGCAQAQPEKEKAGTETRAETVYRVDSVETYSESAKKVLVKATTRTGGWTDLSLRAVEADGRDLTFKLVGTPPRGMAASALESHDVSFTFPEYAETITVRAETNEKTVRLD